MKIPHEGATVFEDSIYGKVEVENKNIDDQVLLKSDGFPTYHLANVVDDHEMKITHVIRAEEWLPSTPKHVLLYEALGWKNEMPTFAHLPMVLGPDKAKLSKRHGAKPALEYRDAGYLPEAVLNFIALLGWNPKTEQEIFSLDELVKEFDLNKVNKSSAVFNVEKLNWMNAQYCRNIFRDSAIQARAEVLEKRYNVSKTNARMKHLLTGTAEMEIDRINTLNDPSEIADYTLRDVGDYKANLLIPKGESVDSMIEVLKKVNDFIGSVMDEHSFEKVEFLREDVVQWIKEQGLSNKQVLWPLRVALTGKEKSPDVFDMMYYWKRDKVLDLISRSIEYLQKMQ